MRSELVIPPRNLDDLLVLLPGMRRLRSLNAALLRVILNRQRGECTWCGQKVTKGRSTWCGDPCVKEFQSRCCVTTAVRLVTKRDQGICQMCGRDTVAAEKAAKQAGLKRYSSGPPGETREERQSRQEVKELILRSYGYSRGQWREVDHKVPVVEGGGLCPISDLRLLCGVCHDIVTDELVQRRKEKQS